MTEAVFIDEYGHDIFPFFALADELRLLVYDHLQHEADKELEMGEDCIALYIRNHPLVNVQLVCHRMTHEYLDQNAKHRIAIFQDHEDNDVPDGYDLPWDKNIAKVSRFRNVELKVHIRCSRCPQHMDRCKAGRYVAKAQDLADRILNRMSYVVSVQAVFWMRYDAEKKDTFPNWPHGHRLSTAIEKFMIHLEPAKLNRVDILAVDRHFLRSSSPAKSDEPQRFICWVLGT